MRFAGGIAAGLVFGAGLSSAQSAVPDAQVEANVLRALAGAPELADEAITTQTVYGTVTLSGTVSDEARRQRAETLAANAEGVKKVVDELRLASTGSEPSQLPDAHGGVNQQQVDQQPAPLVLQSDGTYAAAGSAPGSAQPPAPGSAPASTAQRNNPDEDQKLDGQIEQQSGQQTNPATAPSTAPTPSAGTQSRRQAYPGMGQRPVYTPAYPGYPGPQSPPYTQAGSAAGGQPGGESVVIPAGTMIRVRLNRTLSSERTPAGTLFDGIVANDVVAGNSVAIPRGASVQGTVTDATKSGALKGRGEMSIQLTQVTLAGRSYPIVSDVWGTHGHDKTIETVNKTAGFGAVGAVIGALAGGGVGAAVGGGVGAAAGLGSSAASGNGQVYLPAEALVTFHTVQPATVVTVSEQEMQRLAYGVPAGTDQPGGYRRPYPRVYVGPAYYRGYYRSYYPYPPAYGPYGPFGFPAY